MYSLIIFMFYCVRLFWKSFVKAIARAYFSFTCSTNLCESPINVPSIVYTNGHDLFENP